MRGNAFKSISVGTFSCDRKSMSFKCVYTALKTPLRPWNHWARRGSEIAKFADFGSGGRQISAKFGEGVSAVTGFIHCSAKIRTGLELRHVLFFDLNGFTGSRVAANTSSPLIQRKRTEATDFDTTAFGQRLNDSLENRVDGSFSFLGVQGSAFGGNVINQFRLCKSA